MSFTKRPTRAWSSDSYKNSEFLANDALQDNLVGRRTLQLGRGFYVENDGELASERMTSLHSMDDVPLARHLRLV